MAADFAQFGNGAEYLDPAPPGAFFLQQAIDLWSESFQCGAVDFFLFLRHTCRKRCFHLVWQFFEHILLQPPDQEWLDPFQQICCVFTVLILAEECIVSRKISRKHKIEQAP